MIHDIDPVIFGPWQGTDHSAASHHTNSIVQSLCGAVYRWAEHGFELRPTGPPLYLRHPPEYAQTYFENQSFSKYFPAVASNSVAYTDEPGIADLRVLAQRGAGENPVVLPTLPTWVYTNDTQYGFGRYKPALVATNFAGFQIIGSDGGIQIVGLVGAKNRSQTPVFTQGTNYWIEAGNEYLPASLRVQVDVQATPVAEQTYSIATNTMVSSCVVQLDTNDAVQFQYGYFERTDVPVEAGRNYIAVQGQNLAGLLTPQAERAFDVPVDSATVVELLRFINQSEALSNACHAPTGPTLWQRPIQELASTATGTVMLNFQPTSTNNPVLVDPWTGQSFTNFTYNADNAANRTITINDTNAAPSQLIVNYTGYLGCDEDADTNYFEGGDTFTINALEDDTLAGLTVDESWLTEIRNGLAGIVGRYRNQFSNDCRVAWTLPDLLQYVSQTNDWLVVSNGLVTAAHFAELTDMADVLTHELIWCNCNAMIGNTVRFEFAGIIPITTCHTCDIAWWRYDSTFNPNITLEIPNWDAGGIETHKTNISVAWSWWHSFFHEDCEGDPTGTDTWNLWFSAKCDNGNMSVVLLWVPSDSPDLNEHQFYSSGSEGANMFMGSAAIGQPIPADPEMDTPYCGYNGGGVCTVTILP